MPSSLFCPLYSVLRININTIFSIANVIVLRRGNDAIQHIKSATLPAPCKAAIPKRGLPEANLSGTLQSELMKAPQMGSQQSRQIVVWYTTILDY